MKWYKPWLKWALKESESDDSVTEEKEKKEKEKKEEEKEEDLFLKKLYSLAKETEGMILFVIQDGEVNFHPYVVDENAEKFADLLFDITTGNYTEEMLMVLQNMFLGEPETYIKIGKRLVDKHNEVHDLIKQFTVSQKEKPAVSPREVFAKGAKMGVQGQ